MLIYRILDGKIIAKIPKGQPYDYLYEGEGLESFELEGEVLNWRNCIILNGEIVELNKIEILEIGEYGRILSEDERFENEMLNKLNPSYDEIKKAEQTIEILSLLSEVL